MKLVLVHLVVIAHRRVRGSSRRIKIVRFRSANIRLINRRSHLPRLLLPLSSNNNKNNPTDSQPLTGSLHIREGLPTIWTQLREAAGGRSERGAIQGNRAS
jgi:hypothetical protein